MGFPDDDESDIHRPPASIARTALFAAVRAVGGPWDPIAQTQQAQATMKAVQTEKAAGKVLIVRDVPYVQTSDLLDADKQRLDVYLPKGTRRGGMPLIVHFHGGGWLSGDRRHEMFGAPIVARSHAAAGCVVVTPSYRLGDRDAFMADAQRAVLWAVANATALGADPDRLYLSGHSAGGNIAALLAVGPWLAPPVLPRGAVKGIVGMSGVYTLKRPLGGLLSCYKNAIFERFMRRRVFGDEPATLATYSPSALVRLAAGESAFKRSWHEALGRVVQGTFAMVTLSHGPPAGAPVASETKTACADGVGTGGCDQTMRGAAGGALEAGMVGVSWAAEVPPVLLLNASWDLGLEDDAAYFARSLASRTASKPAHVVVPNTNHATVSWDEASFRRTREFITTCERARGCEVALN